MDAETDNEDMYRLPPKPGRNDTAYTLDEIIAFASEDIQNAYHHSYRAELAIKDLQREVEKAVRDPARSAKLFPTSPEDYRRICFNAGLDKELRFDPTEETMRIKNGQLSWRTALIRAAQNDPLRMARKRVVDLLSEGIPPTEKFFQWLWNEGGLYRLNFAGNVQQLMILMADNAQLGRAQSEGRGA